MIRLRVVLPGDWWWIPLEDPATTARSVDRLVEHHFAGVDDQPVLKRELAAGLRARAADAAAQGAHRLSLSFQTAAGVPLSASLLESHVGPAALDELRAELLGDGDTAATDVPAGRVVRRVRVERVVEAGAPEEQEALTADYWVANAETDEVGHLVFSTPLVALREPMLTLFDAVVTTGRWTTS